MTDLDKSDHLLKFTTSGLRDFSCLLNQLKLKPKNKYFVNSFTGTYTKLVIWLAIWQDWCFGQYSIVSSLKLEVFTNVVNYFSLQILSFVQSSSHFLSSPIACVACKRTELLRTELCLFVFVSVCLTFAVI